MPKRHKFVINGYPLVRPRRIRMNSFSRNLVRENSVTKDDLIWPVFIIDGKNEVEAVSSMPGVNRYTIDRAVVEVKKAYELGISSIALFPKNHLSVRDAKASEALNKDNLINLAVREIKDKVPEMGVICDVALDPYTIHGHDGLLNDKGEIDNDETTEILVEMSLIMAKAGCDVLAPSDMMDGRVLKIRKACENSGFKDILIMSYCAKYASSFYGPFRDAVGSSSLLKGNKLSYQMDPANSDEALKEMELDIQEGADLFIVKPGMPYLDIINKLSNKFKQPIIAYQVSGEYSMIMAAVENGWLDKDKVILESLLSFKRAGARGIISYFAPYAAKLMSK